jgi:hypothetical protein
VGWLICNDELGLTFYMRGIEVGMFQTRIVSRKAGGEMESNRLQEWQK